MRYWECIFMYYPLKIVLPFYNGNNVSYFIQFGICRTEWKKFTCNLSSVQFSCSVVSNSLWCHEPQASLSITNSPSPHKPMSFESVMLSNHLILCRPLLLLPSIFPSTRVFSNVSALCIRWPKYWNFNFNISPSNKHPGIISFRMDWLDLLAIQGTLKNLLQNHTSKHQYFFAQFSLYTTLK